jgi:phosphoenolpyruvate-protein phosphotransferase
VMGIGTVKALLNGDRLIVDGNEGQVILNPCDAIADEFRTLIDKEQKLLEKLDELRDQPAQTSDGQRIRLLANTGLTADIKLGFENGAEGIGLYRTELTFMARDSFPSEKEHVQAYKWVFSAYQNKPVYMRTLDIGGDKQLTYFPIDNEENPALGWRGIRFTLDNIQLLMTQVRAMMKATQGADNLHIMLPLISSIHELDAFKDLLDDACLQLQQEGHAFKRPKVGVMVEVPAAISQLPFWKKKIDFVSIGSNDLSQYLLATDRNNTHVAGLFDHLHPAVLFEVKRIVDTAKQCNLPLSLCGEMGSDPLAVVLLIGMGVRTLSMSAAKLTRIKALIRSVSSQQAEQLLHQALTIDNSKGIRRLVSDELATLGLSTLL